MSKKKNVKRVVKIVGGATCVAAVAGLPAFGADFDTPAMPVCAVSGFNGKLEGAGGFIDQRRNDGGRGHGLLSVSAPLGCLYGFQIDGGIGGLAGKTAGGLAGHLFARDPRSHLYGAYAQWGAVGKRDIWRIGAEAELYRDNISFEFLGGFEDTDRTKSDVFLALDLAFYATENFRISGGYHRFIKVDAAAVDVEWQPDGLNLDIPVSFFVNSAVGSKSYASVYGGVRFHFGAAKKSLIRRHREDDPGAKGIFELLREDFGKVATAPTGGGTGKPSDRRLKRAIAMVGRLPNGLALYRFKYLWSDEVHVGVMAQDVLEVMPEAVVVRDNGFYAVRYDLLGTRMYTYEEWIGASRLAA